jgi:hypothetical protein
VIALWAALAMIVQDILATLLVQAEARNRAVFAGLLDMAAWLCALLTLSWSIGSVEAHGWTAHTIVIVGAVSAANFTGTYTGTRLGKRIKTKERP